MAEGMVGLNLKFERSWPQDSEGNVALTRFLDDLLQIDEKSYRQIALWLEQDEWARHGCASVFLSSPYLTDLTLHWACEWVSLLEIGCWNYGQTHLTSLRQDLALLETTTNPASDIDLAKAMQHLRHAKAKIALAAAWGEISGELRLEQSCQLLSDFASYALDHALWLAMRLHKLYEERDDWLPFRVKECGFFILGMGKLGAGELNYSSDIDLILIYDEQRFLTIDADRLPNLMTKVAKTIVKIMEERDHDGYVFRTDLRLRPDPSVTPPALSLTACLNYYESQGLTWERAAMIKAAVVAGDHKAGEEFLRYIAPFIWRKHLDYAAIDDIQAIRQQIARHKGGTEITTYGHNIKLGQGGIRTIEFFVQSLQLIWGGRRTELRGRQTLPMLARLAHENLCEPETARLLAEAYRYLRHLEHRLQMIDDQQTQTLPHDDIAMRKLARFFNQADLTQFFNELLTILGGVQTATAATNPVSPSENAPLVTVDFTLNLLAVDKENLFTEKIRQWGFSHTEAFKAVMEAWHYQRYRCLKTPRAHGLLNRILPRLLSELAKTANPDEALQKFDQFLANIPAGVALFSLFEAEPRLMQDVALIMGNAPRLAEILANHPHLLDSWLDQGFDQGLNQSSHGSFDFENDLAKIKAISYQGDQGFDEEAYLLNLRRYVAEEQFRLGLGFLQQRIHVDELALRLSRLADHLMEAVLKSLRENYRLLYGDMPNSDFAIVALGKWGGEELLPSSDLDLLFIYDVDDHQTSVGGKQNIGPQVYYMRLCQRFNTAIASDSQQGRLYPLDFRLRPGGEAGPLATQLSGWASYYRMDDEGNPQAGFAWSWESLALTRARVVMASSPDFAHRLQTLIQNLISQPRNRQKLSQDSRDMRERIAKEKPPKSIWDCKLWPGGLVDIEFAAQYLGLSYAPRHPHLVSPNTGKALENLAKAGIIAPDDYQLLSQGWHLWRKVQAALRLTSLDEFHDERAPLGQRIFIANACGYQNLSALKEAMLDLAARIDPLCRRILETQE